MRTLNRQKQLVSDLWLDQRAAHRRIDLRRARGRISETDADRLHTYTAYGITRTVLDDIGPLSRRVDADIERLWGARPSDLAVQAKRGPRTALRDFDDDDRAVGWRINDPHSHSAAVRSLYLHPEIHRTVGLVLGQRPIAIQSVYFEFGSEQAMHRDPMFVRTTPPSHFVAVWVALDDITEHNGPILAVPGSHRAPWYEFERDTIVLEKTDPDTHASRRSGWQQHRIEMLDRLGLSVEPQLCAAGEVLVWHGGLIHGGAQVPRPARTRRSLLIHFSTADRYVERRANMQARLTPDGPLERVERMTTTRIEADGCIGMDNPLRGFGRSRSRQPADGEASTSS